MTAQITEKMIAFYAGSLHDIDHFLKVHAFAALIGKLEGLDAQTQRILEIAAIVHDISCPLCREKYGSAGGKQQERESAALLRPFLDEFPLDAAELDRIVYLVAHHHTYTDIDGADYQILIEADYLVNASEMNPSPDAIRAFGEAHFRTETGSRLLRSIYRI